MVLPMLSGGVHSTVMEVRVDVERVGAAILLQCNRTYILIDYVITPEPRALRGTSHTPWSPGSHLFERLSYSASVPYFPQPTAFRARSRNFTSLPQRLAAVPRSPPLVHPCVKTERSVAAFVAASGLPEAIFPSKTRPRWPLNSLWIQSSLPSHHHPSLVVLVHRELVKVDLKHFLRSQPQVATATPPFTKLGGKSTFSATHL